MKRKDKIKIFKIIISIIIIIAIIAIIVYLFPLVMNLSTPEGQANFKAKVEESGIFGMMTLFALQVAQIFLFIVPGEPIEILSGMCYGWFWGTIFILISSCIISASIFWLVKKFGRKFVYDFVDRKKVIKIEKSKLFKDPKKIEMILLILYLIPGTPKDLFAYVSGLLPIKTLPFVLISTFARIPSVLSSTLAGENLAIGDWKMSIILYGAVLLIVGVIIYIINKLDKDKTTDKILKTIK